MSGCLVFCTWNASCSKIKCTMHCKLCGKLLSRFKTSWIWPCVDGRIVTISKIVVPLSLMSSSPRFGLHLNCVTSKMKALRSLQMSGTSHQITQCNIPEELNLQQHCCENLKSHMAGNFLISRIAIKFWRSIRRKCFLLVIRYYKSLLRFPIDILVWVDVPFVACST